MYFDRFDIVTAYYFFCMEYHEGQFSEKYSRMCTILQYFKPSPLWSCIEDTGNDNAMEIYYNLVKKETESE